ncbi:MAG: hypothetical protein H6907_08720 [Hyphomicrobiales bacterium]|nr:hypothetical protein [Hyphomicrobiales bacterium]MCP5371800.1 hypothetical protein [Hyphomicrobiales bacterium]
MFEIGIIISVLPIARTTGVGPFPDRNSDWSRPARRAPAPGGGGGRGFPWRHFAMPAAVLAALFAVLAAVSRWGPLP